jgi:glutamyl-tRNA synthetase
MSEDVRVRFAPSPTGNVHIGNIRVCIYNWLFARHCKGKMLLRIEDTDLERSTPEAVQTLFDALEWLGIDYDEDPVYQTSCVEKHKETAEYLHKNGYAYYSTKGSEDKGKALVFKITEDASYTDIILGERSKLAEDMADFVILKSDGNPVFHLANVIDDIDMGVTHIMRGNDHVENTFRHVMLYKALDKEPPLYAHFPMIVNEQGKPYSKRDGDAYVGDFREKGFLPEALFNFLALCGWSPGDDREVLQREEMVELFSLERVKASPAQFNTEKMEWMNKEYIKGLSDRDLAERVKPFSSQAGIDLDALPEEKQEELVALFKSRLTTLKEFSEKASYFFSDTLEYDDKGVNKFIIGEDNKQIVTDLYAIIDKAESCDEKSLEKPFKDLMEKYEVGFIKIAQPLRVALTGGTQSPGIFEMLVFLGKEESLRRIKMTMSKFYPDSE